MGKYNLAKKRIKEMGFKAGIILIDEEGENGYQVEILTLDGKETDQIYVVNN